MLQITTFSTFMRTASLKLYPQRCNNSAFPQLQAQVAPQAYSWVKLLDRPTDFSHDEAFLLCEDIEGRWVAWVPDYGEILLHPNQFCQN